MKNKVITNYELIKLIINKKIKNGTYINFYSKGNLNYCKKYLYTNDALWKTEDNIPDELMEVRTSILLDNDNLFEILPEENDEWKEIKEIDAIGFMSLEDGLNLLKKWTNSLIKNQKYLKEKIDNIKNDVLFDYWKDKLESKDD